MLYHDNYFWLGFPFFRDHMLVAEGMRTRYMDTTSLDAIFQLQKKLLLTPLAAKERALPCPYLSVPPNMSCFLLGSRLIGCFCYHQYLCTQAFTIHRADTTQGHALTVREEWKRKAHEATCFSVRVTFLPLLLP